MSFLQQVQKTGPSRYTLPRVGKMNTEVHAFLSEPLFNQTAENLWQQAAESASTPGAIGMYLMPDTHLGYHLPVGGVLVTEDTILQAGSGYDISCFTWDTEVSIVGHRRGCTFKQLVTEYGNGGDFCVYAVNAQGRVVIARAHSPRVTRRNAELVEVVFEGKRERCTPDHEWMLLDGTYKQAQDLVEGDMLKSLLHKVGESYSRGSRVTSVQALKEREDVYCMTVETHENFALASGVFVHNCGVVYLQVPGLSAADVVDWDKRMKWVRSVEGRIAMGVGQGAASTKNSKIEEVLRYGAKAIGVGSDLCERQYIPIPDNFDLTTIEKARDKAGPQLGSVGGGNHFIEMQVDSKDGSVWVMVHCGSRGFGWQAANHFFYEISRLRGLPPGRREESWCRRGEPLGEEYWNWHNAAANYAVANRWTIVQGVQEALQDVYKVRAKPYYEISHNLVQEETVVLPDGTTKRGFVHRKGATRAFPAGHPDLNGTKWEKTGHPCLIPGSMLAGAAILFPLEGAYESGCSVNHGSGRLLARGEAKRELSAIHDDIDAEMRDIVRTFETSQGPISIKGIVGNTVRTPIDECGHVYKDLDEVLGVLVDENVARIERRLYPVANLKGCD